jgi:hypothetical protein
VLGTTTVLRHLCCEIYRTIDRATTVALDVRPQSCSAVSLSGEAVVKASAVRTPTKANRSGRKRQNCPGGAFKQ